MDKSRAKILQWIDDNRDGILEGFRNLVQIPSLTGEEGEGQKFMEQEFKRLGLETDVWEPDIKELFEKYPEVAQYPSKWQPELDFALKFEDICTYEQLMASPFAEELTYEGRPNVVGIWRGKGGGRSLILNGHVDVVTVGDVSAWDVDPFGAEVKDGIVYGRGTTDMKGGLWAMTKAVEAIKSCGVTLKGDLYLESVVNEEHSGNGSLACIARGYKADAAIIPEPTGVGRYSECSGGGIYWEISLEGKEVHTGSRWKDGTANGISAIEKLPKIIAGLMEKEKNENRDEIRLSMGIGMINGGSYATSTAKDCVLSGVAYFSPALGTGVSGLHKIKNIFKEVLAEAAAGDEWLQAHPPVVKYLHYDDAYLYPAGSPLKSILCSAAERTLGKPLEEMKASACDARHLGNQGGMPVIVYGPGELSLAHSVNEAVHFDDVVDAAKVLAMAICDWCGVVEE